MTPVLASPRRSPAPASAGLRLAGRIARDAAEALANEVTEAREASRASSSRPTGSPRPSTPPAPVASAC